MKILSFTKILLLFSTVLFVFACGGGGFKSSNSESNNNGQGGPNPPGPTPPPSNPHPANCSMNPSDLNGYVSQGSATDSQNPVVSYDSAKKEFIIRVPLQFTGVFTLLSGSFPQYPDITFSTQLDAQKGFVFTAHIPAKYLVKKLNTAAPGRLPNGDPLPAVPSGELPQINLVLNTSKKEKVYLYLSKEYFAVLFESKFNHGIDLTSEIRDKTMLRVVGYFHMIAAKKGFPAAFMVTAQFPPELTQFLDCIVND